MRVALIFGGNKEKVYRTIKNRYDDMDLHQFDDIANLVQMSRTSHKYYDRIVISAAKLNLANFNQEFDFLYNYIYSESQNTELILVAPNNPNAWRPEYEGVIQSFEAHFTSPIYTAAKLGQSSAIAINELVGLPISQVRSKYYIADEQFEVDRLVTPYETDDISMNPGMGAPAVPPQPQPPAKLSARERRAQRKAEKEARKAEAKANKSKGKKKRLSAKEELMQMQQAQQTSQQQIPQQAESANQMPQVSQQMPSQGQFMGQSQEQYAPGLSSSKAQQVNNSLDDDDLTLGGLGEQHVETGFLSVDDADEFLNEPEEYPQDQQQYDDPRLAYEEVYDERLGRMVFKNGYGEIYDESRDEWVMPVYPVTPPPSPRPRAVSSREVVSERQNNYAGDSWGRQEESRSDPWGTPSIEDESENAVYADLESEEPEPEPVAEVINKDTSSQRDEIVTSAPVLSNKDILERLGNLKKEVILVDYDSIGATRLAMELVKKFSNQEKILVVDLVSHPSLKNYINQKRYYSGGYSNSLSDMLVYSEDGVDYLLNGITSPTSNDFYCVDNSSKLFSSYDRIFILATPEGYGQLNNLAARASIVFVYSELGGLETLLLSLADRNLYSDAKIRKLYPQAVLFSYQKPSDVDINNLKNNTIFDRVDWFDCLV